MDKEHCVTRQRLLEAAGEVFAERGFREAVVRDICHKAGANVAAINYHFGNKERLYVEVLKYAYESAVQKYPPDMHLPEGAGPEKLLEAFIHSFLLRMLNVGRPAWHGKLMAREIADPTTALDVLVGEVIHPLFLRLRAIVTQLLGGADEQRIHHCCGSIVGQCLYYYHSRAVVDRLYPHQTYDLAAIDELARHITQFSLAGLAAIRAAVQEDLTRSPHADRP